MRRILLTEYATTHGVELTAAEIDATKRLAPDLTIAPTVGLPGRFDLTPASWVGIVRVGDTIIEIRPKVPIGRVVFMIWYTADPSAFERQTGPVAEAGGLLEETAWAFARAAHDALRGGLLRGYRPEEDAIPGVRGRILIDRQIRTRLGVAPPVEVRYDDFTEDIEENRILRAAAVALERLPVFRSGTRHLLRRLDTMLEGVRRVTYDRRAEPRFHWTRLNRRYWPAVELALMILRAHSFELRSGDLVVTSFLVDMNKVFEGFVHRAVREHLGLSEVEFPRGHLCASLDEAGRLALKPDLSWWRRGRCVFVGDCKYKRLGDGTGERADLYQLLAYLVATDLPGGLLVYGEPGPAVEHRVKHLGRLLMVTGIDLRGEPNDLLQATTGIAVRAAAWSEAGLASLV